MAKKKAVRRCEECKVGELDNPRAKYCSHVCQMRAYRRRRAELWESLKGAAALPPVAVGEKVRPRIRAGRREKEKED